MDFDRYGKVKCSKIEGMLPKLMKMVEGEMEKYEKIKTLRLCVGSDGDTITKYKSLWII